MIPRCPPACAHGSAHPFAGKYPSQKCPHRHKVIPRVCICVRSIQHHQRKVACLCIGEYMPMQKIGVRFQKAAHKHKAKPKAHALLRRHSFHPFCRIGHFPISPFHVWPAPRAQGRLSHKKAERPPLCFSSLNPAFPAPGECAAGFFPCPAWRQGLCRRRG